MAERGARPAEATAPYRILTRRLQLRCWSPADAPLLAAAIEANLEHLRPWMPWVRHEPEPQNRKATRLGRFRRLFETGREYFYGVFDRAGARVLGGTGLHRRIGAGAAEIGYWIDAGHLRQGLCTEAAAAVTRAGFDVLGLRRLEIHCDPSNAASAAIPPKLGFTLQVTVPGCVTSPEMAPRETMIWTLLRDDYAGTSAAAAAADIEAYDAAGLRLL